LKTLVDKDGSLKDLKDELELFKAKFWERTSTSSFKNDIKLDGKDFRIDVNYKNGIAKYSLVESSTDKTILNGELKLEKYFISIPDWDKNEYSIIFKIGNYLKK